MEDEGADVQVTVPGEKPVVKTEVTTHIIVQTVDNSYTIDPGDEVTRRCGESYDKPVPFDQIKFFLTHPDDYVDLWIDHNTDEGVRLAVRLIGRNITGLAQIFHFPKEEDQVQA